MRITICGSVKFAKDIVEIYHQLEKLGHEPVIHKEMFAIADGTAKEIIDGIEGGEHHEIKRKYNFIKAWYGFIVNSDAILVCNFDKKGIKNYIGGNTLMEMGFAHVNDKKIFLLNPVPEDVPYADEIKAMVDVVVEGDLSKVNL